MAYFLLILLGFCLAFSARWAISYFGLSCFEQIVFHLKVPLEGTNTEFIGDWFKKCFSWALFFSLLCLTLSKQPFFPHLACILFMFLIMYAAWRVGLIGYATHLFMKTDLYEREYVDGKQVNITFPQKKQNLIYIYVESLETTYTSERNGGAYPDDLIPEISSLAKEHLHFSHQEQLGGAHVVTGTGWTTGGIVAQSSGVPLTVPFYAHRFFDQTPFLPGAYSLGDILKKEGYNQEFLIGSDAYFGGRKFYFDQHGQFRIFDLKTAYQEQKIPQDYHVFWGFEDEKLFSFAKAEVQRLASLEQPFHLSLLTVDTHHTKGYQDQNVSTQYPERLSNIIRGNSQKIGAFIDWLKTQPFYDQITIVIAGDHLSMAAEYISQTYDHHYDRTTMNVFIHAQSQPHQTQQRLFTSFDLFPTTLAALGATIEGDRLGLGVNLFSQEKTLAERIGLRQLNQALMRQSAFYREKLLGYRKAVKKTSERS